MFSGHESFFTISDLAHSIVLANSNNIPREISQQIISYLLNELTNNVDFSCSYSGEHGDFFSNRVRRLQSNDQLDESARYLNLARPRRESTNFAFQLLIRHLISSLSISIDSLSLSIKNKCLDHLHAPFTDFTYDISTVPTTIAHFLSYNMNPINRSLKNLYHLSLPLDLSPCGAGSSNGTVNNLNRSLYASLFDFTGIVSHCKDASWMSDVYLDIALWICSLSSTLERLCADLLHLISDGVECVSCSDEHSRISYLMPHKKNPYQLSIVRGYLRELNSKSSIYLSANSTKSGFPDPRHTYYSHLSHDISFLDSIISMLADIISGLRFNQTSIESFTSNPFIYSSSISSFISSHFSCSDRTAHELVSKAVTLSTSNNEPFGLKHINHFLAEYNFSTLNDSYIETLFNPTTLINSRSESGSCNPSSTQAFINDVHESNHSLSTQVQQLLSLKLDKLVSTARTFQ